MAGAESREIVAEEEEEEERAGAGVGARETSDFIRRKVVRN